MKAPSRRVLVREFSGRPGYILITFEPGKRKDGEDATICIKCVAINLMQENARRQRAAKDPA